MSEMRNQRFSVEDLLGNLADEENSSVVQIRPTHNISPKYTKQGIRVNATTHNSVAKQQTGINGSSEHLETAVCHQQPYLELESFLMNTQQTQVGNLLKTVQANWV